MHAVIKTGGKQYLVKKGDILKIEKIDKKVGSKINFTDVLLYFDEKTQKIGNPRVKGAKVEGEILEQGRDKKISIIKYKSKIRYHRKKGHRQAYSKVKIEKVGF